MKKTITKTIILAACLSVASSCIRTTLYTETGPQKQTTDTHSGTTTNAVPNPDTESGTLFRLGVYSTIPDHILTINSIKAGVGGSREPLPIGNNITASRNISRDPNKPTWDSNTGEYHLTENDLTTGRISIYLDATVTHDSKLYSIPCPNVCIRIKPYQVITGGTHADIIIGITPALLNLEEIEFNPTMQEYIDIN